MATQSLDVSDRRLAWIDDKGQPQPITGATVLVSSNGANASTCWWSPDEQARSLAGGGVPYLMPFTRNRSELVTPYP